MSSKAELLLLAVAIIFLAAWCWFWTGPELDWERQLYAGNSAAAEPIPQRVDPWPAKGSVKIQSRGFSKRTAT